MSEKSEQDAKSWCFKNVRPDLLNDAINEGASFENIREAYKPRKKRKKKSSGE